MVLETRLKNFSADRELKLQMTMTTTLKSVLVEDREMCDYFLISIFKKYSKEYQALHFYFKYFYWIKGHNLIQDFIKSNLDQNEKIAKNDKMTKIDKNDKNDKKRQKLTKMTKLTKMSNLSKNRKS